MFKCLEDDLENAVEVLEDLVVPETKCAIAPLCEPGIAFGIFLTAVLAAVDLDDETFGQTGEVRDVGTEGHLSSKTVALELTAP